MIEGLVPYWDTVINHESIWVRLAVAALIFLLALLVRKIFTSLIFGIIFKITHRTRTGVDKAVVIAFEDPLRFLIVTIGLYLALIYLPLSPTVMAAVSNLFRSAIIVFIIWGFYNLVGSNLVSEFSEKLKVEPSVAEFVTKLLRFAIIALAITIIAQEWDYDVNGFLAGLGLGGLALALAAQDTISNTFGGIIIVLDRPFCVGDWISTPSVEGTVEDMSFRSTKVRNAGNAVVTVPNRVLANEAIANWSRMQKRQLSFNFGVNYSTPREKLETCVYKIKEYVKNHSEVHPDVILVNFDSFSENSLDISLIFYTKTTVWSDFRAIKEEINYKIMEIVEEEGVSFAFPSRSVYFENKLETDLGVPEPDRE